MELDAAQEAFLSIMTQIHQPEAKKSFLLWINETIIKPASKCYMEYYGIDSFLLLVHGVHIQGVDWYWSFAVCIFLYVQNLERRILLPSPKLFFL